MRNRTGFVETCRYRQDSKSKKVNEIVFSYAKILRTFLAKYAKNKKFFLRKKEEINIYQRFIENERHRQYVEAKALIDSGVHRVCNR